MPEECGREHEKIALAGTRGQRRVRPTSPLRTERPSGRFPAGMIRAACPRPDGVGVRRPEAAASTSTGRWRRRPNDRRRAGMPNTRVAVVTGGSAGVGREVVRSLAARGWDVAVLARGEAGVQAAVEDVRGAGRRALGVLTDVADPRAVTDAAERGEGGLGPIGAWVNVAFVGSLRYFWDTDPAGFARITEVTYLGQVNGTRAALAVMRPRDHGVIVNVGSALAFRGIPLQAAYCGAKHAVKGFTESVRAELLHTGSRVRICQVQLPGLNTPQFDWNDNAFDQHPQPVPPVFQPE